jgi:hypothetical protein
MYYRLESDEFEKIKEAEKITCTDYEIIGNLIPAENLMTIVEDLLVEIDTLNERYEDLERTVEEEYRPITKKDLYGVSDRDFL